MQIEICWSGACAPEWTWATIPCFVSVCRCCQLRDSQQQRWIVVASAWIAVTCHYYLAIPMYTPCCNNKTSIYLVLSEGIVSG